jgi:hypothetical protein
MAAVCVIAFFHYRLTRNTEPPGPNEWFTRLDRRDVCGVLPLLVSVGAASFAARALLFTLSASSVWIFQAGETVIINTGALALFAAARSRKNAEFKWVAVLVTAVGGGKVFLYDLLRIKGIPVVVSVLSFVLPAGFGSWVLSRWHRSDNGK